MNEQNGSGDPLQRIAHYETLLQTLERALRDPDAPIQTLLALRETTEALAEYYESDVWKQDFADDEAGLFPKELRRGVLSEDGIYNALEEYRERLEAAGTPPEDRTRPYYDRASGCWRVEFPDRPAEEGSLLYVACEFARAGLYYPYNNSQTRTTGHPGHGHAFEDVLRALLEDPEGFDVGGFEESYARQEIDLLNVLRKKLLETK